MGTHTFLDCGSNGAMTTFSFAYDADEDEIHNEYACAVARNGGPAGTDAMPPPVEKATLHGPSGSEMSGRDAMWDLDQHVVDCGDQFLRRWVLRQWSRNVKIEYAETTDEDVARARFGVDRSPRARATTGDERDARPARGYLRLRRDIFISGGDERA